MRKRNWKRSFSVQRLEDRRLLAADVAVDLAPVDNHEPEMCQVAELESQVESNDQGDSLDLDSTEIPVDVIEGVVDENPVDEGGSDPQVESEIETEVNGETESQVESQVHDLGDPVDGTDGFFGSIDADNPEGQLTFSPSEEGMIGIVVASSFGGAETRLEVTDAAGELVTSTVTEELTGFQKLTFEADAGETYQLNVSSEEGTQGYFQVTVEHNEFLDLHTDTIGEDSTELQLVDGNSEMRGELELAGDVDTFRFIAESNGKALLGLAELDAENSTELQVQVLNADGGLLTRGITNETVGVSFDVEQGTEYFLAVSAGEGQTGAYGIDIAIESTDVDPDDVVVDDAIVDDVIVDEVAVDDVIVEDVADDQPVDETVVDEIVVDDLADQLVDDESVDESPVDESAIDDSPVGEVIADNSAEDGIDELPEDQAVTDQPSDVEVVEDAPADEIADVVDVEDTVDEVTVDQVDDIPAFNDPSDALNELIEEDFEPIGENEVADQATADTTDAVIEDVVSDELDDIGSINVDVIDAENEVCYSDLFLSDGDVVDSFFAQFNPDSIFQVRRGFGLRS